MPEPANLIFFLSDNHNATVLGCYGHDIVHTPALDTIARRGVRFRNSYCASTLCCPSRAAIASGRYPHQTGYWDNCLAYDGRVPGFGHRVREAGGSCTAIGKLHFRCSDDDNGFDQEIAPMHIVGGHGALTHLLRWNGSQPPIPGQWDLYWEQSGVGETEYQAYDREITRLAVDWLRNEGARRRRPWVLLVSYVSSHPPFKVPQRFFDRYPPAAMPLPLWYQPEQRPDHPAMQYLRDLRVYQAMQDADRLRRIAAGYFGLVSHLDEQIGTVMAAAESNDLLQRTRVLYTSDHGESFGHHGLFGKSHLLEPAARVPLLMCGPEVPENRVVDAPVQSIDLFPTIVAGTGGSPQPEADMHGRSLWSTLQEQHSERRVFAEFHACGSLSGSYLWRRGNQKLVYHVGMRPQIYDLGVDPTEGHDLAVTTDGLAIAAELEAELRTFIDPEAVDKRARSDQRAMLERHGGEQAVRKMDTIVYTPPPGAAPKFEPRDSRHSPPGENLNI